MDPGSDAVNEITLKALREALRQDGEIRLVSVGKKSEGKGLFPTRAGPNAQAIKACFDGNQPLFNVAREEKKGKTQHLFVRINDRGIETLLVHLSPEEFGTLLNEVAPALQSKVVNKCLHIVQQRFDQLETKRLEVVEARKRTAMATLELTKSHLGQLETEKRQLDQEINRIENVRSALAGHEKEQDQDTTHEALTQPREELPAKEQRKNDFQQEENQHQHPLDDLGVELATVRDLVSQREQEIADARQEVEAAQRRAEDYIHEATLVRDNAVRSFQASLWNRLKACLVEILDEHGESAGLNPDQVFFRQRLREIRDTLRDLGVPPY